MIFFPGATLATVARPLAEMESSAENMHPAPPPLTINSPKSITNSFLKVPSFDWKSPFSACLESLQENDLPRVGLTDVAPFQRRVKLHVGRFYHVAGAKTIVATEA
jgi:hypothetical protein